MNAAPPEANVVLPPNPPFYVGVDVGGTNIKAGVVDETGRSFSSINLPTEAERGSTVGLANICRAIRLALDESPVTLNEIQAIGLATPGTMDIPAGMLLDPPNLPGWINFPIRDRLAEEMELPTTLQNDANAAAYGEFWAGAGKGAHSIVFWTLGTGVGCGIIIGDTIIEGAHSHGAESGHIIVQMNNGRLLEGTGQYGTLEAYAGAKGLIKRALEAVETGNSILKTWMEAGQELTPLLISQAAEQGDRLADDLIMETARIMGVGTTSLMHTIDPDMVLFGGAMTFGRNETELGRRFLSEIQREVKIRALPVPAEKTRIAYASLGSDAGYIGAAGCARLKHKNT